MFTLEVVPNTPIVAAGPISDAFLEHGPATVRDAFERVWRLPYGRVAEPGNPLAPLAEGRGTCSTKHALLARLLDEQELESELRLGIYEMCEANTPGVGEVLARHGLSSIPEAHCYLIVDGQRVDVTRLDGQGEEPISAFMYEEPIEVEDIGEYKRTLHRRFIDAWALEHDSGLDGEELWAIREACIEALA